MKKLKLFSTLALTILLIVISSCNNNENETIQQNDISSVIDKITKDNIIEVSSGKNGEILFSEKDGFEDAFSSKMEPGDILCKGSGVSFARCVKKNLDNGKTMKLYKKGDTYYAEEM